jgi:type I restriction enzyme R subunit
VGSLIEFLRHLLEIEGIPDYHEVMRRQFDAFVGKHTFSADQIHFLRAVENTFLKRRRLDYADLFQAPFTAFGDDAVERWFTKDEVDEVLTFVHTLTVVR